MALFKLKYYCQLCERQLRDSNAFKCHENSNTHRINLEEYNKDPQKAINMFSERFQTDFITMLTSKYGAKPVSIHVIYNEFIADRAHVHLSATKWSSVAQFAKFLSDSKLCTFSEDQIAWIDPAASLKRKIVEHAPKVKIVTDRPICTSLKKFAREGKISFDLRAKTTKTLNLNVFENGEEEETKSLVPKQNNRHEILQQEKPVPWLLLGIQVKVYDRVDDNKYYQRIGNVMQVMDDFYGLVQIGDDQVIVNQNDCRTVLPTINGRCICVKGKQRGCKGILKEVRDKKALLVLDDSLELGVDLNEFSAI